MIQSFVKCFHPLVLRDPRGYPYQVPCGKCVACQNNKRSSLSLKLRLEEYTSKYCYFLTLTYDDDHLPLFSLGRDTCATEFIRIYPYSERLRSDSLISDFCSDFYEFDNDFIDKMDYYCDFVLNYERKFGKHCVYGHGLYALLYYRDIQLFLKRLRNIFLSIMEKKFVSTLLESMVQNHCVRIGIVYSSSTRLHLVRRSRIVKTLAQLHDHAIVHAFYVRSGNSVFVIRNVRMERLITTFLRMLTSLLIFQSCWYYFLIKKRITLSNLVRFYHKKVLFQLSKKVTFRFLSDNSMSIHLALKTLIPFGGRITLGSSQSLPVQVSFLLNKHIEYLRATKH